MNGGIEKALCSLSYISVDKVADTILQLGPGTLLGKMDEPDKSEGPASTLSVLGIEVDSVATQLQLPADKLHWLQETTKAWGGHKYCTKQELLSLIGLLQHATTAIQPGWSFVPLMIDLSAFRKHIEARLHLNRKFRSDLEWWFQLPAAWNGTSILAPLKVENPDLEINSDSSGTWECGAVSTGEWFQLHRTAPWPQCTSP